MASGTLTVKVLGDASHFERTVGKLEGGLSKIGTVAKFVGATVAAGLAASVGLGLQRLVGIEEAQAKLRGLGHDAATVDQIMVDALASVKGTAFGLADAATAAAGAIASGVKPGQDLERTLKLVGDTATIAGAGFDEMGAIFNKVGASNRLTMGEVNQLADRGVPIMQWLADQYGVTALEARKMVEQGKVDFSDFRTAIETNIGGAALESGNTTKGAFENMKAAAGRFGAALIGPVFGNVKGFFGSVTGWIDTLAEKAGPFAEEFGRRMSAAFAVLSEWWNANSSVIIGKVTEVFGAIKSWIDDVTPAIQSWVSDVLGNVTKWWEDHGPTVIAAAVALKDGIVDAIDLIVDAVQLVVDEWDKFKVAVGIAVAIMLPHWAALAAAAVASSVTQVAAWVATSVQAVASAVIHSAQVVIMIARWVAMGVAATANAAVVVAGWVATSAGAVAAAVVYTAQTAVMVAKWIALGVVATAQAAIVAAAWVISMGPIALVAAAVAALAVAFVLHWDTIRSAVLTGVQFVVDKMLMMAEKVVGAAATAFGWVPGVGDKLREAERAVAKFREDVNRELALLRDKTVNLRIVREDITISSSISGARTSGPSAFHAGGIFRAHRAGGEGLALLRDRERVSTPTEPAHGDGYTRLHPDDIRELGRVMVQIARAS